MRVSRICRRLGRRRVGPFALVRRVVEQAGRGDRLRRGQPLRDVAAGGLRLRDAYLVVDLLGRGGRGLGRLGRLPLDLAGALAASGDGASPTMLASPPSAPPMPSSALVSSAGTIQTLLAVPLAICGSACRYWYASTFWLGLAGVDRVEDGPDRLRLALGLEDPGLPVTVGAQHRGLLVTLGGEDLRLLDALGGEDRRAAVPLGAHLLLHRVADARPAARSP